MQAFKLFGSFQWLTCTSMNNYLEAVFKNKSPEERAAAGYYKKFIGEGRALIRHCIQAEWENFHADGIPTLYKDNTIKENEAANVVCYIFNVSKYLVVYSFNFFCILF